MIPPTGEGGNCAPTDLYGVCAKIQNNSTTPITSACATSPDPLNDPKCRKLHVIPWLCYDFRPATNYPPGVLPEDVRYEGDHCAQLMSLCGDSIYAIDSFLPAGGLLPGQSTWIDISFYGGTPPVPLNNVYPMSCLGSGYYGFDLAFREPSGGCGYNSDTNCDWQAGIRSAKIGPYIEVPAGTLMYIPSGALGCTSALCVSVCNPVAPATTCQAYWDFLANHQPPNYPTARCQRSGTPIDCAQFQSGDIVFKNWLMQASF
jgi:hypothetical protein